MAHKKTFEEIVAGKPDVMLHMRGITADIRISLMVYLASKLAPKHSVALLKTPYESAFRLFYSIDSGHSGDRPVGVEIMASDILVPQMIIAESPRIQGKISAVIEAARDSPVSTPVETVFKESPMLVAKYITEMMDYSGDFTRIVLETNGKKCTLTVIYNALPKSREDRKFD